MNNLQWMNRHLRDLAQVDEKLAKEKQEAENKVRQHIRAMKQNVPETLVQVRIENEMDSNPWAKMLTGARDQLIQRVQMFALAHIAETLPELRLQVDARRPRVAA